METVLIRERYKVVQVLEAGGDYAFAETVDITDREMPVRLLNIYEGQQAATYAAVYTKMEHTAFCEAFLCGESLVVAFLPCTGLPIDRVFYRGAVWDWQQRLEYAELLLHQALSMANLPPAISCAAWLSENVYIDRDNHRVGLRWRIRPMAGMNARELALLAGDQAQKVLAPRFAQGDAEAAFAARLRRGEFVSIVPLYAAWRRAAQQMREEYEALDKKNKFKRWFALLWKQCKRQLWKRRERRG